MYYQQAIYEVDRLIVEKWAYGERIFSAAFLGLLLGAIVGWWNHRSAAAVLIGGYILVAVVPFMSKFDRSMIAPDPQGLALRLLPFGLVGLLYAYSGRRRSVLI